MDVKVWNAKSVFVTGATGLLGSWLVDELIRLGARVTCLVRDWVPESRLLSESSLKKLQIVRGELEDFELVLRALNEYEIDTVFHLGAQTIVGTAAQSPLSTFESNIKGTWVLLEACRICNRRIQRVVVASSDKAYGNHEDLPYTENTALVGRFPYDASKSCADLLAFCYYHTYGLPVSVTRCGNLFGGGDLNFNRLIPGIVLAALRNERPIIRSDGSFVRDYFYVRDAVAAYLSLAERMPGNDVVGQAFNFGIEQPRSVLEITELVLRTAGKRHLDPEILGQAEREIPKQWLDCTKARNQLGWRARYSLESGLRETIDWYANWLKRANG